MGRERQGYILTFTFRQQNPQANLSHSESYGYLNDYTKSPAIRKKD